MHDRRNSVAIPSALGAKMPTLRVTFVLLNGADDANSAKASSTTAATAHERNVTAVRFQPMVTSWDIAEVVAEAMEPMARALGDIIRIQFDSQVHLLINYLYRDLAIPNRRAMNMIVLFRLVLPFSFTFSAKT